MTSSRHRGKAQYDVDASRPYERPPSKVTEWQVQASVTDADSQVIEELGVRHVKGTTNEAITIRRPQTRQPLPGYYYTYTSLMYSPRISVVCQHHSRTASDL